MNKGVITYLPPTTLDVYHCYIFTYHNQIINLQNSRNSILTYTFTLLTHLSIITDNTKSNQIKVVKTPGGRLVAQHIKKQATRPKCGDCGCALSGVATLRPRAYASISKTQKTVSRAYGGSRCANCVKERIVRAFLIEEQKVVKKVVKESQGKK